MLATAKGYADVVGRAAAGAAARPENPVSRADERTR